MNLTYYVGHVNLCISLSMFGIKAPYPDTSTRKIILL